MPLKESYVIWNNKGGVGKTTLTFHMATQYARRNPGLQVLVIDLCPQANVSMALLSSPDQQGNKHLFPLFREKKTVSFYLHNANAVPTVDANDYLTRVNRYNNQVPANLHLLCGDMNLELVGRHLDRKRAIDPILDENPWLDVTTSIRAFIEGSDRQRIIKGVTENRGQDGDEIEWVVFIDTNPAFSVYTEIAIAAANKLIIPINADDFSKEAVQSMLDLVYGIPIEDQPEDFKKCRRYFFAYQAKEYGLELPQIHLLVNNRTTTRSLRSVNAFQIMGKENLKVLFEAYQQHQRERRCFVPRETEASDIEAFKQQYFIEVRDFHSTAILSIHSGCPLGLMSGRVALSKEKSVKVDARQVKDYSEHFDDLMKRL